MNGSKLRVRIGSWIVGLSLTGLLAAPACEPLQTFSDVPEIAPLRVTQKDTAEAGGAQVSLVEVTVSWKDGNGDLGYVRDQQVESDRNYFLTIEKKKNGAFKVVTPLGGSIPGNFGYNGYFENLNPEGPKSTKAFKLTGDLSYRVNGKSGFVVFPPEPIGTIDGVSETVRAGDVLRFQVQIKDRAGNLSNTITTEEVTL